MQELMERFVKIRKQIFTAVFFHLEALFKGATASAQNGYMELRAQNGQLLVQGRRTSARHPG